MKELIVIGSVVVLVALIITGGVSYSKYIDRNKEHIYNTEEVYANECSKRGGNPTTKVGNDYSGDKSVTVQEYKCEVQ